MNDPNTFEAIWQHQQGALFLKKELIYDFRKDLAQFFYESGRQSATEQIDMLEEVLSENFSSEEVVKQALEQLDGWRNGQINCACGEINARNCLEHQGEL